MKTSIIIGIGIGVAAAITFGVLFTMQEIEKQEFIEMMSTGHSDCMIQKASGGSENQFIKCELDYIKSARQGCMKFPNVQGCDEIENIIDENNLQEYFP